MTDPAGGRPPCPVCRTPGALRFMTLDRQDYWRCETCQARFLDARHWPNPAAERAHYLTHENDADDPGYRRFLGRLVDPLLGKLASGTEGLDFGCGPGPALAAMLREAGHDVAVYDPFFYSNAGPLDRLYDFITCTEVIEHFHHPADEFERFARMLRPGGWLGLMTCFQTDDALFANWRYRKDPTHVVFYRERTLRWIAERQGWSCEIPAKDVALMQKP